MRTVRRLHDRAMCLADEMIAARKAGDDQRARLLASTAHKAERDAFTLSVERGASDLTRVILLRSAVALLEETRR